MLLPGLGDNMGLALMLLGVEHFMLDAVFAIGGDVPWAPLRAKFATEFSLPEEAVSAAHGNLSRLGIWGLSSVKERATSVIAINKFGLAFIAATHGPGLKSETAKKNDG